MATTSTFDKKVSEYTHDGSVEGHKTARPRINQPQGFETVREGKPTEYYGEKHNYVYYPCDWCYNGVLYKRGYYDENGTYYENITFKQNGIYHNIICKCDYCGSIIKTNWNVKDALQCRNCGGSMTVVTPIDVYTQDPDYTIWEKMQRKRDAEYNDPKYREAVKRNIKRENLRTAILAAIAITFLLIANMFIFSFVLLR